MAFSNTKRKEIKKSSYYVWFLGAKESGGLRGEEYIRPAVRYLTERENEVEPLKVTLQVSTKGLKIIQNVSWSQGSGSKSKTETLKHFIPDHSITCVTTDTKPNDDVVACILLIYNPTSKCPVHVHAYRCDTVETASLLRDHLQSLVDRPENQRKFVELERRLQVKGLLPSAAPRRLNSDGRSIQTTESDSSASGSSDKDIYALDERMSGLYDSLAAELREKLNNNKNHGPLLLPPKDYDTVHRTKSKPEDDDLDHQRRVSGLQRPKVAAGNGSLLKKTTPTSGPIKIYKDGTTAGRGSSGYGLAEPDSSGKSSGIGSDEAPSSPTHERGRGTNGVHEATPPPPPPKKQLRDDSSSDEEWHRHRDPQATTEREMILVQSPRHPRRSAMAGGRARAALRSTEDLRRSPSPPSSSRRPPSPKPPPNGRDRYYDGHGHGAVDFRPSSTMEPNGKTPLRDRPSNGHTSLGDRHRHSGPVPEMDRNSRTMPYRNGPHEGGGPQPKEKSLLRRVKSREEKDQSRVHSERDTGYGSRSDRDPFGSRDLLDQEPNQYRAQLSHSRSHDHLRISPEIPRPRRENGHHVGPRYVRDEDAEDSWTPGSDQRHQYTRRTKSPSTNLAKGPSSPDLGPSYRDAYVPLPRIRRLDPGQPSASQHSEGHHHGPHRSTTPSQRGPAYNELPKDKRYPGLDRDTARYHTQQHSRPSDQDPGWECSPDYRDSRTDWDPQECTRAHSSKGGPVLRRMESGGSSGSGRPANGRPSGPDAPTDLYSKTSRSTNRYQVDKMDAKQTHHPSFSSSTSSQGVHKRPTYYFDSVTDDKRFYRYSSSDADNYRSMPEGGRRKVPPSDDYRY